MEKPVLVSQVQWNSTDAANAQLINFSVGDQLGVYTAWQKKLVGYRSIRATAVLRTLINMSPFQQGALMAYYTPLGDIPELYKGRELSISGNSQFPGVRMNSCNNECIIEIPYLTPNPYYDLTNSTTRFDWARFIVRVLSTLKTGSSGQLNAEVSVFLSFKDVDLQAPIFPQSTVKNIARRAFKNMTEKESSVAGGTPVADFFGSAKKVSDYAKGIPLLSAVAEPTSWFLGLGAKICTLFGWSKPLDEVGISRIAQVYNYGSFNADGKDLSQPISMMACNKVQILSGVPGHDMDEMSFDFIKRQPAYVYNQTITTTDLGNVNYYDLNPSFLNAAPTIVHGVIPFTALQRIPVTLYTSLFDFYRGSLTYTFRFIKTGFHTGTLAIAYVPYATSKTTITVDDLQYLHTEFIDISQVDVVKLNFPFASPLPFLKTNVSYGRFYLYMVNNLRCPETVSQNINIVIEVEGGDDFECAVPKNIFDYGVYPQSGLVPMGDRECVDYTGVISGGDIIQSHEYSSYCIGEKIMSLLQFLKSYNRVAYNTPNVLYSVTDGHGAVNPHLLGVAVSKAGVGILGAGPYLGPAIGDALSLFARCFVFRRGSVRLRAHSELLDFMHVSLVPTNPGDNIYQPAYSGTGAFKGSGDDTYISGSLTSKMLKIFNINLSNTKTWNVQVPFYCQSPLSPNLPYTVTPTTVLPYTESGTPAYQPSTSVNYRNAGVTSNPTNVTFTRAVGEDFQFCMWIGAPLVLPAS